jgi:hypothetical protein
MSQPARRAATWHGLLAGSAVAGAAWWACGLSMAPFVEEEKADRAAITALQERLAGARQTIEEIRALEEEAARARAGLQAFAAGFPAGSAYVWFPAQVKEHFARFGFAGAVARVNTARDEPDLPHFERTYWAVEFPVGNDPAQVRAACLAVAEIEPRDCSVRLLDVAIRPDADDPARRRMVINISTLFPKAGATR